MRRVAPGPCAPGALPHRPQVPGPVTGVDDPLGHDLTGGQLNAHACHQGAGRVPPGAEDQRPPRTAVLAPRRRFRFGEWVRTDPGDVLVTPGS